MKLLLIAGIATAVLVGCEEEKVASFDLVDEHKGMAKENATYNAKIWRSQNMPDAGIYVRGDSTLSQSCPFGDGWATVDIVNKETREKLNEIKCSTFSVNEGCHTKEDFITRPALANQDGKCAKEHPSSFPKVDQ